MRSRNQDFLLGLVVIGFVGLFVGTIVFVYPYAGAKMKTINIRFRADAGAAPLKPGSPVTLGGAMQVGKVTQVKRDVWRGDAPGTARPQLVIFVTAEVEEDLPLYTDCVITTDQPPVGGGGMVVIVTVGLSASWSAIGRSTARRRAEHGGGDQRGRRAAVGPDGLVDKLEPHADD